MDHMSLMLCVLSLVFTLLVFLLIYFNRFILDRGSGIILIVGYLLYLTGSVLNELYNHKSCV